LRYLYLRYQYLDLVACRRYRNLGDGDGDVPSKAGLRWWCCRSSRSTSAVTHRRTVVRSLAAAVRTPQSSRWSTQMESRLHPGGGVHAACFRGVVAAGFLIRGETTGRAYLCQVLQVVLIRRAPSSGRRRHRGRHGSCHRPGQRRVPRALDSISAALQKAMPSRGLATSLCSAYVAPPGAPTPRQCHGRPHGTPQKERPVLLPNHPRRVPPPKPLAAAGPGRRHRECTIDRCIVTLIFL
jgi:hypothetical protein